jgi:hypothetical protein
MQWDSDPWTSRQVTLAVVAVLLAICCLATVTVNKIRDHIVAQPPEDSVALLFPLGAERVSLLQMQRLQRAP